MATYRLDEPSIMSLCTERALEWYEKNAKRYTVAWSSLDADKTTSLCTRSVIVGNGLNGCPIRSVTQLLKDLTNPGEISFRYQA